MKPKIKDVFPNATDYPDVDDVPLLDDSGVKSTMIAEERASDIPTYSEALQFSRGFDPELAARKTQEQICAIEKDQKLSAEIAGSQFRQLREEAEEMRITHYRLRNEFDDYMRYMADENGRAQWMTLAMVAAVAFAIGRAR